MEAGVALEPTPDARLRYRSAAPIPGALVDDLKPVKEDLAVALTDRVLAASWPGLPVHGLTPSLRTLLAWYDAEWAHAPTTARAHVAAEQAALERLGWPAWHARIRAVELALLLPDARNRS